MNWADLLIICWVLWGGVAGFLLGARRTCSRAGVLLAALVVSNSFKTEIRVMLDLSHPVTNLIRETVNRRLIAPVLSLPLKVDLPLPLFLNQLYLKHPSLSTGGSAWMDLVYQAILNVICFSAAFLVWGCGCYAISSVWLGHCSGRLTWWERWGGIVIGMAGAALLAALAFGVIVPLLALLTLNSFRLEDSVLFQLLWAIADRMGLWWD